MTWCRGWRSELSPDTSDGPVERWAVPLAILVALLLYFWPLFVRGEHAVPFHFESAAVTGMATGITPRTVHQRFPDHDDSPVLITYPNAVLAGKALRGGELPTWNPYVGCGTPAMAGGQVFPFSPFLWPFYLAPGPRVYTLGLMAIFLWMAWGAYLWLGRFVSGPWLRLAGALVCAFNPWTARIFIFSSTGAACWLGWILWAWSQALDGPSRRWWLPAVMIALSAFCGHPEAALLMAGASACYAVALWATAGENRLPLLPFLGTLGGVALLSVLLAAVQWLPVVARLPEAASYKFEGAEANVTPGHYLLTNVFNPRSPVFINPTMWGLLLLGLVAAMAVRRLWPVLVLAAVSLQLSFWTVSFGPLVGLQTAGGTLPGIYARGSLWFSSGALVAVGLERLCRIDGNRWLGVRIFLLGMLAFVGFSWADYQDGAMVYLLQRRGLIVLYAALAVLVVVGALSRPGVPRRLALVAALTGLVVAPLADEGFRYSYFNGTRTEAAASPAVVALGNADEGDHGRAAGSVPALGSRPCLSPNLSTLWDIRDARVLDVLQTRRLQLVQGALGAERKRLLGTFVAFPGLSLEGWAFLGVGRLAVPDPSGDGRLRWDAVPDSRPRAFVAHRVTATRDETASWRAVKAEVGDGADAPIVVEGWTGTDLVGSSSQGDGVRWEEDGLSRVRLRATAPAGGLLVLLDTYASGWRAEVDGKAARIYPADLAFRAVELPPGSHDVVFRYRPLGVRLGLLLSGGGWLLVLVLGVFSWRRHW